jgi:hypothetical protein
MTVVLVALAASGSWAEQQLASVTAGEAASGEWTVLAPFVTAEQQWQASVRIEGPGRLTICYPARQRTALTTVRGPTEGTVPLRLRMRANPGIEGPSWRLAVQWTFEAGEGPATCWIEPREGSALSEDRALEITPLYQHRVPRVTVPPVIDGDLSDACWNDEAYIDDPYWRMFNIPRDAQMATHVWCAYDDENLYVAFRCETPDVSRLRARVRRHDGPAWQDDCAEIFFDPRHDHYDYYELNVTPREVAFDCKWVYQGPRVRGQWLIDWDYIGEWRVSLEPDAWVVEIRLALESYEERDLHGNPTGFMPLPTGDVAGILFSRNDRVTGEGMSHADNYPSFHEVQQYGHLVGFRPNRPEAYRKTALREVERLERRWGDLQVDAGRPEPVAADEATAGMVGLAEAIGALRRRAAAPAPEFDEWVAVGVEIRRLDAWLDGTRALLSPDAGAMRWREAPWTLAVADVVEPGAMPEQSATLQVPDRAELAAAGGEVVSVQVVVIPGGGSRAVGVAEESLVGPGGVMQAIEWYGMAEGGRLVWREPVPGGQIGHLWWEIDVPRDAVAGVYEGHIVTTDGENRVMLPVRLTVHDFALPEVPTLAASVSLDGPRIMEQWYGERSPLGVAEYLPYAEALLAHRLTPREMLADHTRWSSAPDFASAERLLERVGESGISWGAMIAARPEQLAALDDPAAALGAALEHWHEASGIYPLWTYVPEGTEPPDMGGLESAWAAAVASPATDPASIELFDLWAMSPRAAVGLSDCAQAQLTATAGELGRSRAWRVSEAFSSPMDLRMLGWVADKYGVRRIFFDDGDAAVGPGEAASGLLHCLDANGRRLIEPQPTVALKLLRDALQDYERLRILRGLERTLVRAGLGDRFWRLRFQARSEWYNNRDMVMNVADFNHDPRHLADRRERVARQIVRMRKWLSLYEIDEPMPGDVIG